MSEEDLPATVPLSLTPVMEDDEEDDEVLVVEEIAEKRSAAEESPKVDEVPEMKKVKVDLSQSVSKAVGGTVDLSKSTCGLNEEKDPDNRRERALELLRGTDVKWAERKDYSGRHMYGKMSVLAVVLPNLPSSAIGVQLLSLGMESDNMAHDYVYYFM